MRPNEDPDLCLIVHHEKTVRLPRPKKFFSLFLLRSLLSSARLASDIIPSMRDITKTTQMPFLSSLDMSLAFNALEEARQEVSKILQLQEIVWADLDVSLLRSPLPCVPLSTLRHSRHGQVASRCKMQTIQSKQENRNHNSSPCTDPSCHGRAHLFSGEVCTGRDEKLSLSRISVLSISLKIERRDRIEKIPARVTKKEKKEKKRKRKKERRKEDETGKVPANAARESQSLPCLLGFHVLSIPETSSFAS